MSDYAPFKDDVVNNLSCDGPADRWYLTGAEIDAALADDTEAASVAPDGR